MPSEQMSNLQSHLQDLVAIPREELDIELKGWLDISTKNDPNAKENQADLAQAILALANHGGGYILIGFAEVGGAWQPDPNRPTNLKGYSQDAINSIVQRFAEPSFHCSMHHIEHPTTREIYPVIVVPGGHRVPIRSKADGPNLAHVKQNCYYIRRLGPKSEQIQTAKEWDDLINRCVRMAKEELLTDIRSLLFGIQIPNSNPDQDIEKEFINWVEAAITRFKVQAATLTTEEYNTRYEHGVWTFAYRVIGDFKPLSHGDFLDLLNKVDAHLTGWPVWTIFNRPDLSPSMHDNVIECWLKDINDPEPRLSDFWWASPKGMMFLLRGYGDDSSRLTQYYGVQPGTVLDPVLPIWEVGECLLHAQRLANALSDSTTRILVQASWEGLSGRVFTSWHSPGRVYIPRKARTDRVVTNTETTPEQIDSNLPEVVSAILQPLYDVFGFFKMPIEEIQKELIKMKNRQY